MLAHITFKSLLLTLGLLMIPVFAYLWWPGAPTLDTVTNKYVGVGGGVKQDFQSIPTLPLTEEKDTFTLTDNTSDGIDIQFANQSEAPLLGTETPKLNLSFPKDYSQPIEVKLDDKRTVNITDLSGKSDYAVETLGQEALQTQPENKSFFQKLFPKKEKAPQTYLRYTSDDERKSLLYAYQKDQASGEKKLKHWTLYESGDGIEQESYKIDNAKVKVNSEGVAEVFYYTEQDLKNDQAAAGVDENLMARAQRTLAKEMGDDLLSGNHTPDFTIPKPYYIDAQGEKHEAEWKWSEENTTLSVSFSPASYPVALDPTLSFTAPGQSNTGTTITGESGSTLGNALVAGDFNADGRTDLAVGAMSYTTNTGRVYVFYNDGSIATTALGADVIITGQGTNDYFGSSLLAGDMNTDGKIDLVVAAYNYSNNTGRVYIFNNDSVYPTLAASADTFITGAGSNLFGGAIGVGDFNFDGRTDIAVGASSLSAGSTYIYYNDGSMPTTEGTADVTITGTTSGDAFGYALSSGDYNSDGRVDLLVAAKEYSSATGRTYVFYNDGSIPTTAATADVIITGEGGRFGKAMVSGDFNTDGRTDFAVLSQQGSYGRAYIFYGDGSIPTTAATADVIIDGSASVGDMQYGTFGAGDWNADGRTDISLNTNDFGTNTSKIVVFYNDGSYPTTNATSDVIITLDAFAGLVVAGDFNGDGKADMAVGVTSTAGRTYIFYSQNGQVNTNQSIVGEATNNYFGISMTTGDYNADGRIDLVVGAYAYSTSTGRAYIFYGDGQIPTTAATADVIITGESTSQNFGRFMTSGDFNADGKTDLAVSAHAYSSSTGRVYIFNNDGSIPTAAASADVIITGESSSNNFGMALFPGDFNADGKVDIVVGAYNYSAATGRAYIFYNGSIITENASGADVIITGENAFDDFAFSLTAGDLNADGRIDLVAGAYAYTSFGNTGRAYIFYNDGSIPTAAGSADVIIDGEGSSQYFSKAMTTGDFNADGRTDLVMGAESYTSGTGRVYIFHNDGSIPTAAGSADTIITGETTNSFFGFTLVSGDMNADGRTDLAVGGYGHTTSTGRVYIFYNDGSYPSAAGSADVIMNGETTNNNFGSSIVTGDMNGDGRADLIVSAYGNSTSTGKVYFYETRENFAWQIQKQFTTTGITRTSLNTTGQEIQITGDGGSFGYSLLAADLNADGKTDLVASAYLYNSNTGRAYIFYNDGSLPTGVASADVVLTGETTSNFFGFSLSAGDFNSDGRTDLAVGGYGYSTSTGRTYIFYNDGTYPASATNADIFLTGESSSLFGVAVVSGDFNSDGRTDLAVGGYGYSTNTGRVYIFHNDGSIPTAATSADVIIIGETTNNYFGLSLTSGDYNANGTIDLAVSSYGYSTNTGRVYIFHNDGSIPTAAGSADVIITGGASGDFFGSPIASGDWNADGKTDLAVGSTAYSTNTGRAYIFNNDGSIPTTADTADVIITGETTTNYFGLAMTSGDMNGDGRTDLIIGARYYSSQTGRAYIFYNDGSIPTTAATADVTLTGETTSNRYGLGLTTGDFNGDGRTDLAVGASTYSSSAGKVYIYTFNDPVITGETVFGEFAYAMAAGDLNADGRTDLVVGAWAYTTNTGRVYLFYNDGIYPSAAASADVIMTGETTTNYFGAALATGDFNTDGKVDLAVGASRYSSATGRSYIFYNDGSYPTAAGSADVILNGDQYFGSALAAGDFNADGRVDLAVGAYNYGSGDGRAYIFHNDGSYPAGATTADVIISGEASSQFGYILVSDDLNADGETDLAIGASAYSSATGRAYIFNNDGSIPTTAATADVIITGETTSNNFGLSMATGDFNTDGKTDLAVGASGYSSSTGRAYIFNNDGSLPTTAATADSMITGETTSNSFATSLASGDLSADGRADLIVGAGYTSGRGRVYIFYNDGALPSAAASADMIHTGTATFSGFGIAMAIGDWNVDGKMDLAVGADAAASNGRVYLISSEVTATSTLPGTFYMKGTGKLKGTGTIK